MALLAIDRLGAARRQFLAQEAVLLNDPVRAARVADELGRSYRQGERLAGALALLALAYVRLERYAAAEKVALEALAVAERQVISAVTSALDNPATIARRALNEARYRTGHPVEERPTPTPTRDWGRYWQKLFFALVLAAALFVVVTTLDSATALLLLAVAVAAILFVVWRWILPSMRLNRPNTLLTRIQSGDHQAVLSEIQRQWNAGQQTPVNAVLIAMAILHDRRPADAEPFARQARDLIHAHGFHRQRNVYARWLAENAALALYNARLHQGRYVEAADALRERLPFTSYPSVTLALIIWALFLGGDLDSARTLFARLQSQDGKRARLPEPYQLAQAYVQVRLFDADPSTLCAFRGGLAFWQDEAKHYAGTPYGERLQVALDDIGPTLKT